MEEVKGTKLIGIGNDGIQKLEEVESKVVEKMDIEKISINKDVDKDYVRALLDGVDILLLTYNSEDNADNDEYLFGNFAGSNWERMAEHDNFGLPQESKDGKYVSRSLSDLLLDIRMEPGR